MFGSKSHCSDRRLGPVGQTQQTQISNGAGSPRGRDRLPRHQVANILRERTRSSYENLQRPGCRANSQPTCAAWLIIYPNSI